MGSVNLGTSRANLVPRFSYAALPYYPLHKLPLVASVGSNPRQLAPTVGQAVLGVDIWAGSHTIGDGQIAAGWFIRVVAIDFIFTKHGLGGLTSVMPSRAPASVSPLLRLHHQVAS